jgi:type I restriction enzyme S subunit
MKYKLKYLCSITKGATGIMKADGGKYPLVALSDERRSHSEFQFDAKAVIVPLISSTGHGHASMKRVHYQEGKFALGNILCAVIPNDEKKLNAKYLHLYLQQFKETLLVPLMKGAANVSLPMNKLADVEIEVPSLERQLEIIELEEEAAEYKNELEERLITQDGDVAKLRQALLREAMQGKLTKQDAKDGNAISVLEKIRAEKEKLKNTKAVKVIKEEEIPCEIPSNWCWCRLEDLCLKIHYGFNASAKPEKKDVRLLRITDIQNNQVNWESVPGCDYSKSDLENYSLNENDIVIARTGGTIGKTFLVKNITVKSLFASYLIRAIPSQNISSEFLKLFLESPIYWKQLYDAAWGAGQPNVNGTSLSNLVVPLPPFAEQNSIVKRIEQLMQLCDELQYSIQQSKIENEKLLQGALRDALRKENLELQI